MIVLEDVYKRYRTPNGAGKWVLNGISLTIPKQCNVGLIGVNGAGKSTLLRLIGGIDRAQQRTGEAAMQSLLAVGAVERSTGFDDRPPEC